MKSFDLQIRYTEFLTVTVEAASAKEAVDLVLNRQGNFFPTEYWNELAALQAKYKIDFCDNDTDLLNGFENLPNGETKMVYCQFEGLVKEGE